ncbi:hypothetical protein [Streptomyces paludis]|uniref:Uncharacterized protein n=1 Tax=Streptomyces paludis TaxID=2282738 RepID=A0A345HUJ8_9ACTN|nr:hypothetical protein [Streptomyces paludis]AXG80372.1 hypothetical protein DVK44_24930 [Streptomyces paludis]
MNTDRTPERETPHPLVLADGERAVWARIAGPRWMTGAGTVLALVGVTGGIMNPGGASASWFFSSLPFAVALILMGTVRVSVDDNGVVIAPAVLPVLRRRIRLDRIRTASARWANLVELGGLGYRVMPGRHAIALRTGDSLWLRLDNGRDFVITVDNATGAAALVNALLARAQRRS